MISDIYKSCMKYEVVIGEVYKGSLPVFGIKTEASGDDTIDDILFSVDCYVRGLDDIRVNRSPITPSERDKTPLKDLVDGNRVEIVNYHRGLEGGCKVHITTNFETIEYIERPYMPIGRILKRFGIENCRLGINGKIFDASEVKYKSISKFRNGGETIYIFVAIPAKNA